MKLTHLLAKELASLKEKKNIVGGVPAIGLTIHVDTAFDKGTNQLNISVSNQSGKAPEYTVPNVESDKDAQTISSGVESEMAAAIKAFSEAMNKILEKYQQ